MDIQVELTAVLAVVLPIVVVLTGTVVGLVTYIIRRVVRRIDIMAVQLQELESERARVESDRAHNDHRWQVSRDSRRDLIEFVDVKFAGMADRNRVIEQGHAEIQRRYDEIQRQHGEILNQHVGMQRDIEELRVGLREIRDRIDAED